jgi:hypothetical protein
MVFNVESQAYIYPRTAKEHTWNQVNTAMHTARAK